MWCFVSVPLSYIGSRYANSLELPGFKLPGTISLIPRPVPPQRWFMNRLITVIGAGVIPFVAIFVELYYIMASIWQHHIYFLFGFLFLVFLALIITCAEVSIVLCYFQITGLDWEWWWRTFFTSGASAFYIFGYSIYYFIVRLDSKGFVPGLLFFGYTTILTLGFFIMTGMIGFCTTFYFLKKIYTASHQD